MELLSVAGLKAVKFSSVLFSDKTANPLCCNFTIFIRFLRGYKQVNVKQSRYRPGVAQRVPGR